MQYVLSLCVTITVFVIIQKSDLHVCSDTLSLTISCITTGICSVISIKDSFLVQPAGEGEDFSRWSYRTVTPEQSKCASYWHYSGTVRHRMCAVSATGLNQQVFCNLQESMKHDYVHSMEAYAVYMLPWKPQMWASMADNIHQPTSSMWNRTCMFSWLQYTYMVGSSFTKF